MSLQVLRNEVFLSIRRNSTAAVLLHAAIGDSMGLGPTDLKALDFLYREGPLTATEIAGRTSLTPASVTALIDRLESKGFVKRVRDEADRRKVSIQTVPESMATLGEPYAKLSETIGPLLEPYDEAELATIRDFLDRATAATHAFLAGR
jgi:DNA-binding MarR family transcriptional regulator